MNTRYSKTTGCFYPLDIDYGDNLPADAIEVDIEIFNRAMSRSTTQKFDIDENGALSIYDIPAPTKAEVLDGVLAEIRAKRAPIIATLDGIAGRLYRSGDTVGASAADGAINALLDLTTLPALLDAKDYTGMQAAISARYAEIIADVPDVVKSAFNVG